MSTDLYMHYYLAQEHHVQAKGMRSRVQAVLPFFGQICLTAFYFIFGFDAFLAFLQLAAGIELRAVREGKCTRELCPGVKRMQLTFCGVCISCFLRCHTGDDSVVSSQAKKGTQFAIYAPTICSASASETDMAPTDLVAFLRKAADGWGSTDSAPDVPADWPLPWQFAAIHVAQLRALELSLEGRPVAPLRGEEFAALRGFHHTVPPIKVTGFHSHKGAGTPRLVVILHGGLQTARHLKYMCMGANLNNMPPPPCGLEIIGVEADFAHESIAAGLEKPVPGFNYVRFEGCFSRFGEYVLSASRVWHQCLDAHLKKHPKGCDVDLFGFSAGSMLAWLLLCMAPASGGGLRLRTLSLLSPRLEGLMDCWEPSHVRSILEAHGTQVFLGYGELENTSQDGAPFSAMAAMLRELLPGHRLQEKAYPAVGHSMPPQELDDVKAFLGKAWQSGL